MGTWSTRIFDNDITMDIIGEYKILLGYGISPEETYEKIYGYFAKDFIGKDNEDDFWLGIALYQWKNGILIDEVKGNALRYIDDEQYLERWKDSGEKVYQKRKKVLEEFKDKLLHEVNPRKKKFPKCPAYYREKTDWKIGDLIAYKIKKEPHEANFHNKYFLLRVIDVEKWPISHVCPDLDFTSKPLLMLYDWYGNELPAKDIAKELSFRPIFDHVSEILVDEEGKWLDNPYWVERVVSGISLGKEPDKKEVCETIILENDQRFCNEMPALWLAHAVSSMLCPSQLNNTLAWTFKEWGYEMEFMIGNWSRRGRG